MKNFFDFSNQTAVITGGRRGLGRQMAATLAECGADIVVVGKQADCDEVRSEVLAHGVRFHYIQADLRQREERARVIPAACAFSKSGAIDILINNAGAQSGAPLESYSDEMWDSDLALMLTASFELARDAAVGMKARQSGKIVNMASISSFQGARNIIGYSTAKHGVVGLTKCLANELAPFGINVNAIAPGIFRTDMAAGVFAEPARAEGLRSRIPDGRFGELDDIVGPLLFLCGPMSSHVHGHILLVDGGWMGR